MSDEKHDESFKVVDRRLFTADGELRKEVVEQQEREERSASAQPKPAAGGKAAAGGSQQAPAVGSPPASAAEAPQPSRGFQMLVDFMARNAAVLLGGYADPRTGQPILDLEGAREMIDMLDALQEKTRGNLAADDENLLLDVLGNLKLSYLELSKAAAKAMQEKAKSKS